MVMTLRMIRFSILFAEDDKALRDITTLFLCKNGFAVDTAEDGNEAAAYAEQNLPSSLLQSIDLAEADRAKQRILFQLHTELMVIAVDAQFDLVLCGGLLHDRESQRCTHAVPAGNIAPGNPCTNLPQFLDLLFPDITDNAKRMLFAGNGNAAALRRILDYIVQQISDRLPHHLLFRVYNASAGNSCFQIACIELFLHSGENLPGQRRQIHSLPFILISVLPTDWCSLIQLYAELMCTAFNTKPQSVLRSDLLHD